MAKVNIEKQGRGSHNISGLETTRKPQETKKPEKKKHSTPYNVEHVFHVGVSGKYPGAALSDIKGIIRKFHFEGKLRESVDEQTGNMVIEYAVKGPKRNLKRLLDGIQEKLSKGGNGLSLERQYFGFFTDGPVRSWGEESSPEASNSSKFRPYEPKDDYVIRPIQPHKKTPRYWCGGPPIWRGIVFGGW